ncbi:MAG: NADH-quinone oxidoreductase subunit N [Pirellulaceae bacterium]|nr:NADH-quinone oxidoreductase subunit N [Pirellulaceae bacterium]
MNLHELVSQLIVDTSGVAGKVFGAPAADSSLRAFLPELVICATVLVMLLVRLFRIGRRIDTLWIALAGSGAALYFAAPWEHLRTLTAAESALPAAVTRMEIFTGMLVYDTFSVYIRSALLLFAVLFVVFTKLSGIPDHEDAPDIYALVLGSTLGMCLMASANHLLMVFMAVEMASVPSYVLAGLMKGKRLGSEAALKYSVYGAGAAGVMLYGISLIAGLMNTAHLPTLALQLAEKFSTPVPAQEVMVLALGGLLIAVGLAFKLSAVPFHFWCPDVFEGATAEVNAFLSVASKAAALALLVRVAIGVSAIAPAGVAPGARTAALKQQPPTDQTAAVYNVADEPVTAAGAETDSAEPAAATADPATAVAEPTPVAALAPIRSFIAKLIALLAIVTCTFGNLAAYGQTNIKRLFAYSTIAHAGYMMMPVAAAVALAGIDQVGASQAIAALAIYIAVYLFMNLAAFAVVAFLRNALRTEEIADYSGLIRRSPLTVVCFSLILFSLIGLPPLSGFIGKFAIFASLVSAWRGVEAAGEPGFYLLLLLIIGGLNTAISLFYYLRVVKVMTIDDEPDQRPAGTFSDVSLAGAFLWMITVPTALLIVAWDWLSQMATVAAMNLLS